MSEGRRPEETNAIHSRYDLSLRFRANVRASRNDLFSRTGDFLDVPSQSSIPIHPFLAYRFQGCVGISSGRRDDLAKDFHSAKEVRFLPRAKALASAKLLIVFIGGVLPRPSQSLHPNHPLDL